MASIALPHLYGVIISSLALCHGQLSGSYYLTQALMTGKRANPKSQVPINESMKVNEYQNKKHV